MHPIFCRGAEFALVDAWAETLVLEVREEGAARGRETRDRLTKLERLMLADHGDDFILFSPEEEQEASRRGSGTTRRSSCQRTRDEAAWKELPKRA